MTMGALIWKTTWRDEVWGKKYTGDNDNIRICIRRLRHKLRDIPPDLIINQLGAGYMVKI